MSQKTKLENLWKEAVEEQDRDSIVQLWDLAVSLFEDDLRFLEELLEIRNQKCEELLKLVMPYLKTEKVESENGLVWDMGWEIIRYMDDPLYYFFRNPITESLSYQNDNDLINNIVNEFRIYVEWLFDSDNYENLDSLHPQYQSSSFSTYMRIRRALAYDVVPQDDDV